MDEPEAPTAGVKGGCGYSDIHFFFMSRFGVFTFVILVSKQTVEPLVQSLANKHTTDNPPFGNII